MSFIKRSLALLIAALFVLAVVPAASAEGESTRGTHSGVTLDTNSVGGYEGDYVVIYNPSDSTYSSASTGSLAGLIETEVYGSVSPAGVKQNAERELYRLDADAEVEASVAGQPVLPREDLREEFTVGMTRNFYIANYNPAGTGYLQFKLLYQGAHCNIWTVTEAAYKPLDLIDESFASAAAEEFDAKFALMISSYGSFNDMNGDGRVNLMYYNIDDGWTWGQGYVAGYFSKGDFESYNYLPMIHIDTYPGIQYVNGEGVTKTHFEDTFGTVVHEFQHCINYSVTGGMATWLNEAFSGSAEELCYPGSGLFTRIQDWHDHRFTREELSYPPTEYAYNSGFGLHKGGSITSWSNAEDDIYARYGLVMLFTQYLSTRYGSTTIYKQIIDACQGSSVPNSYDAITAGTGWTLDSVFGGFYTSLTANDADSGYGFRMSAGYDPDEYYGIEDLYSLLSPVVYTSGAAANIYSGGCITIKPKNGVFVPPSGASSTLRYVGISFGNIPLEGVSLAPQTTEMLMEQTAQLTLRREPADANDFEITWSSSDESVALVSGSKTGCTVTSSSFGTAIITATARDNSTGSVYTASALIKVKNGYTYTRYEPANEVELGMPYLIGYDTGDGVYLMMNYNPNCDNTYYPRYYNYQNTYYAYGVKAVADGEGNITGVENAVYPDAAIAHTEWVFEKYDNNYYKIRSGFEGDYYLSVYAAGSSYYDLYAHTSGSNNKWKWNSSTGRLYYEATSSMTKYATFVPSVGEREALFGAYTSDSAQAAIKLYKKVTNTVIIEDGDTHTVTFVDWDGTVIDVQTVEDGASAAAPADPVREGYTFIGWDTDFTNVHEDLIVTALYEENQPEPLPGDADCNGVVDMRDVTFLNAYLVNCGSMSAQGLINANVNGGELDAYDSTLIAMLALGIPLVS